MTVFHSIQKLLMKALGCLSFLCAALFLFTGSALSAEAVSAEGFRAWVYSFRATAIAAGITPAVYDSVTQGITPDFTLPDLDIPARKGKQPSQAEFVRTPVEYLNEKYLNDLAAQGRQLYAKNRDTLAAIAKTYRVDPYILLAIWWRETAFGTSNDSTHNALQVLATLSYAGNRKELFQKNFLYAIKMVQDGAIAAKDMKSSWAGAMGLAQFMPEDYYKYGVSLAGNAKPDLWHSVPDALASLANNLAHRGWDIS